MDELNQAVAAYWAELQTNSIVSTSHVTLYHLYARFGESAVQAALEPYFAAERAVQEAWDRDHTRKFYESYGLKAPCDL